MSERGSDPHRVISGRRLERGTITNPAKGVRFINGCPIDDSVTKGFEHSSSISGKNGCNSLVVPAPKAILQHLQCATFQRFRHY